MRSSLTATVLLLITLLLGSVMAAAAELESKFTVSDAPPPGFEDLGAEQTGYIDVRFGGRVIASASAIYDDSSLKFDDAAEIVAQIPLLKEPQIVKELLESGLSTSDSTLCLIEGTDLTSECQKNQPPTLSITLNTDLLKATIHLNPIILGTSNLPVSPFLDPTGSELGFITRLSLAASGASGKSSSSSASSKSVLSKGRSRFIVEAESKNFSYTDLRTLLLQHDSTNWLYELGTFTSGNDTNALLKDERTVGFRVQRSLALRKNTRLIQANELTIFLPERSRVDIRRDGVLLDSRFYPSGNQLLNTSRLPDGAYPITVKISNSLGEKTEHHTFVRHSNLPPSDIPLYYLTAGKTLPSFGESSQTESSRAALLDFGTTRRLSEHLGASIGHRMKTNADPLLHASIFGIFQKSQFQLALKAEPYNLTYTSSLTTQTRLGSFSVALQQDSNLKQVNTTNRSNERSGNYSYFGYSTGLAGGILQLSTKKSFEEEAGTTRETRLAYSNNLRLNGHWGLNLNGSILRKQEDTVFQIGFEVNRYRDGGQFSLGQEHNLDDKKNAPDSTTSIAYARPVQIGKTNTLESLLSYKRKNSTQSAFTRETLKTSWSQTNLEAEHQLSNSEESETRYSATFDTALATNFNQVAFGSLDNHSAAIIALVEAPENEQFTLLINGQPSSVIQSGKPVAIGLKPYSDYQVSITNAADSESLLDYDVSSRDLVVLPGNLSIMKWTAAKTKVVVLQAKDANNKPLANQKIMNITEFSATDSEGWLQVELNQDRYLLLQNNDHGNCRIELEGLLDNSDLQVFEEPLICIPEVEQ
ncbi:MAG: TcfC E-set like domain-containing protein [Thiotrichales bacterium]